MNNFMALLFFTFLSTTLLANTEKCENILLESVRIKQFFQAAHKDPEKINEIPLTPNDRMLKFFRTQGHTTSLYEGRFQGGVWSPRTVIYFVQKTLEIIPLHFMIFPFHKLKLIQFITQKH